MTDATWSTVCLPAIVIALVLIAVILVYSKRKQDAFYAASGKTFEYEEGKIQDASIYPAVEDGPAWGRGEPQPERTRGGAFVMLSERELALLDGRETQTPYFTLMEERITYTNQGELPDMTIARDAADETRRVEHKDQPTPADRQASVELTRQTKPSYTNTFRGEPWDVFIEELPKKD